MSQFMDRLVTVSEMIAIEQASDRGGHSYGRMMAAAGLSLAKEILDAYRPYFQDAEVLFLVGHGNNGGDALVAGKWLLSAGWACKAYMTAPREGDPLVEEFVSSGGEVTVHKPDKGLEALEEMLIGADLLVDGLLGTGIKLPLREPVRGILAFLKDWSLAGEGFPDVVAVDCPSGVDCDSGEVADETLFADLTVCMAAVKDGLLSLPAFDYLGRLVVGEIGLDPDLSEWKKIRRFSLSENYFLETMPLRPSSSHKGSFGKALIIGGSENYPGAPVLAGKAAFRAGAGWVTVGVPDNLHPHLAGSFLEATWLPLPEDGGGLGSKSLSALQIHLNDYSAVLAGPGVGLSDATAAFVRGLVSQTQVPLVVDADGLKALAEMDRWWEKLPDRCVLTPHPGEFSILTGLELEEIQSDRLRVAKEAAARWECIVVLKGAFTVVADPAGKSAVMPLATAALARAGTGDVLAGIITGLLAQGLSGFDAACCGVWAHGQTGLLAKEITGSSAGVLAGDLIEVLPDVMPF